MLGSELLYVKHVFFHLALNLSQEREKGEERDGLPFSIPPGQKIANPFPCSLDPWQSTSCQERSLITKDCRKLSPLHLNRCLVVTCSADCRLNINWETLLNAFKGYLVWLLTYEAATPFCSFGWSWLPHNSFTPTSPHWSPLQGNQHCLVSPMPHGLQIAE